MLSFSYSSSYFFGGGVQDFFFGGGMGQSFLAFMRVFLLHVFYSFSYLFIYFLEVVGTFKRSLVVSKHTFEYSFIFFFLQSANSDMLTTFINTLNGKDGNLCHLVTVPPGPLLSDALISSPILQGEDGAAPGMEYASEYGFDPNSDPELALVRGCILLPYF